jgi:hypothetical protein
MKNFLLEINTKGIKDKRLLGSMKSIAIYINEHLEKHYLDYDNEMIVRYSRLKYKLRKAKIDETVELFINNSIIQITKLEKIANYVGTKNNEEILEIMR